MSRVPHEIMQNRVLVLLSNSAHAGKVPQPVMPKEGARAFEVLDQWWKAHGDKVVPADPWLEILEKQRLD